MTHLNDNSQQDTHVAATAEQDTHVSKNRQRIHFGLASADISASTRFYRTLFQQEPVKTKNGYAKFEPQNPDIILSLIHTANPVPPRPAPDHFGVQVNSAADVHHAVTRLQQAGYDTELEEEEACCYAVQTKVWTADPDGNRWEVFATHQDSELMRSPDNQTSATDDCCDRSTCCTDDANCC